MRVSFINHKSTKASIKSLKFQAGQIANKLVERNSKNFSVNTKENPKSSKIEGDP